MLRLGNVMLGFRTFALSDLTATLTDEPQRVALEVDAHHFGHILTSAEAETELTEFTELPPDPATKLVSATSARDVPTGGS